MKNIPFFWKNSFVNDMTSPDEKVYRMQSSLQIIDKILKIENPETLDILEATQL